MEKPIFRNPIVLIIRWLIFIPIYIGVIALIMFLILLGLKFLLSLGFFWFLVIVFFLGGVLSAVSQFVSMFLSGIVIRICPHYMSGAIIFTILTLINNIVMIVRLWGEVGFKEDLTTFGAFLITFGILGLTFYMIAGAFSFVEEN